MPSNNQYDQTLDELARQRSMTHGPPGGPPPMPTSRGPPRSPPGEAAPMPGWLNDSLEFLVNQALATGALLQIMPSEETQKMMAPYTKRALAVANHPAYKTATQMLMMLPRAGAEVGEAVNRLLESGEYTTRAIETTGALVGPKRAEAAAEPAARQPGYPPAGSAERSDVLDYIRSLHGLEPQPGGRPQVPVSY